MKTFYKATILVSVFTKALLLVRANFSGSGYRIRITRRNFAFLSAICHVHYILRHINGKLSLSKLLRDTVIVYKYQDSSERESADIIILHISYELIEKFDYKTQL